MNTLFTGQTAIRLNEVGSTNEYALNLLKNTPIIEGTIIIAKAQTGGKGQRGKTWITEPGQNITMSLIFHPDFLNTSEQFVLNKAIALAVADFIKTYIENGKNVSIKWPNDIYIGHKKIAGILIENIIRNSNLSSSIIGIGININQTIFDSSLINPTSLMLETNQTFDTEKCIQSICSHIEANYILLRNKKYEEINSRYNELLYKKNSLSQFKGLNNEVFEGEIQEVDNEGRLKVKLNKDTFQLFSNNEISMLINQM